MISPIQEQHQHIPLFTKIYLGQLPIAITEHELVNVFKDYCQFNQIKIIKANTQGYFTNYCYAFLNIRGDEAFANQVIRKVQIIYPTWRANVKADYQKLNSRPKSQQPINQRVEVSPNTNNKIVFTYNQPVKGIKNHKILVREIWLGGIPEGINDQTMRDILGYFGLIQSLEIFSKFAFVKFKLVNDATTAFEKASRIYQQFAKPMGFRIFFSDPQKRSNIVSNHYEFDRQSQYLPILFLGFPPVTSSFVDEAYMRSICQKYGPISDVYVRKNTTAQMRSYILITYTNMKSALKAKQQLSKKKDILGDKRVEVTLILNQQFVLRGRDLQTTIQKFQNNQPKKSKSTGNYPLYSQPIYTMNYPSQQVPMFPYQKYNTSTYNQTNALQNPIMPYFNMAESNFYHQPLSTLIETESNQDVSKIIQSMVNGTIKQEVLQKNNLLDKPFAWTGSLYKNRNHRINVSAYSKCSNFQLDIPNLTVNYLLKSEDLILRAKKNVAIIQPAVQLYRKQLKQYINELTERKMIAICLTYKEIIFLIPKSTVIDDIFKIDIQQLLMVSQDIDIYFELKDKLIKIEEFQ